jgi:hypothetical protein
LDSGAIEAALPVLRSRRTAFVHSAFDVHGR